MNFRLVIFLFVSLFLFFEKSENNIIEYSQVFLLVEKMKISHFQEHIVNLSI